MKQTNIKRLVIGLLSLIALILIRNFETELFYDPLISYFKQNYHNLPFPNTDYTLLYISYTVRFLLNSFFSIAILWNIFQKQAHLKIISIIYLTFYIVLLLLLCYSLHFKADNLQILIYTRRFLIHPILLLIFIGALFYQKRTTP
ncbi:exosortase F system-associated membrane protein [Myroides guanonis]|uniref:Exosortase F-associated protein n=1 Tax=Myroides guanonis TaxID=1150112 RepID=A0A1I3MIT2_9FLAO|nr:exosortase F-associated protein [Myroides guanonis]